MQFIKQKRTYQEYIGNGIQDNEDSFAVFGGEQIQKRFKHIWLHKANNLLHSAPTGEVCNSPHSLFLSFVVTLQKRKQW